MSRPSMARRRCAACGRLFPGGERFCSSDGEPLEPVEVDDPYVGRVLGDRFRVQELLSSGGMGRVYRAEQMSIARPVALKLLHPERATDQTAMRRFEREAWAIAGLKSPHTVRIYDFGRTSEGHFFMAMELLQGETLKTRLAGGAMTPDLVVHLMAAVARSLGEAHAAGIVHRDLKPSNVFLAQTHDYDPLVKVLDFGIASGSADDATLTRQGRLLGTPGYMAPERVGGGKAGPASDIYSLGVIAHECLAGEPLFSGSAEEIVEAQLRHEPPPLPSSVPAALRTLVHRCLAKSPHPRPPDGGALMAEIERLGLSLDGTLGSADEDGPRPASGGFIGLPTQDATHSADVPVWAAADLSLGAEDPQPPARLPWRSTLLGAMGGAGLAALLMMTLGTQRAAPVEQASPMAVEAAAVAPLDPARRQPDVVWRPIQPEIVERRVDPQLTGGGAVPEEPPAEEPKPTVAADDVRTKRGKRRAKRPTTGHKEPSVAITAGGSEPKPTPDVAPEDPKAAEKEARRRKMKAYLGE